MPKYSVLIPVYNCEKYLAECLDSVLAQTYSDFEVIAVDDGSTDGSGKICDEYAIKDKRVKVIHKQNEGVFRARKTAFENSSGEYILTFDSDDVVDSCLIGAVDREITENGFDLVLFGLDHFSDDVSQRKPREVLNEDRSFEQNEKKELYLLLLRRIINSLCIKCCPRKSYACGFECDEYLSLSHGEDWFHSAKIIHATTRAKYINKAMYHYRKMNEGLSTGYDEQSLLLGFETSREVLKMMEEDGCLDREAELEWMAYCRRIADTFFRSLFYSDIGKKEKLQALKKIENTEVFKISVSGDADLGSSRLTVLKFRLLRYRMYSLLLALMRLKK